MSEKRPMLANCHRKLPTIPRHHRRYSGSWPPYKNAVEWMHRHKDILETALALVEIHPRLIQNKVCDKLYDFISDVTYGMDHQPQALPNGNLKEQCRRKIHEEPKPLKPNKTDQTCAAVKHAFICGVFSSDLWTKIIIDLCKHYFVMCTDHVQDQDWTFGVSNADIFIFVMDDQSICDNHCLDQLETALIWDKPIIFIRDENLSRPNQSDNIDHVHAQTKGETNLKDINYQNGELEPHCFTNNNNEVAIENASHIEKNAPCHSTPDLCMLHEILTSSGDMVKDQQRKHKIPLSSSAVYDTLYSLTTGVNIRTEIDEGFNKSVLYHKHLHEEFMTTIFPFITQQYGENKEKTKQNDHSISVKDAHVQEVEENKQSVRKTEPEVYAKSESNDDIYYDNDSESSGQDTIYLIYANDDATQGSPKVVHWPSDLKEGNMSQSPSIDSFGFEDIDLSKKVNNLDIFSDSDTD